MNNFFDRFKPGGNKQTGKVAGGTTGSSSNSNPLTNLFGGGGTASFSGTGQSLGGNVKPGIVIPITLSDVGPIGVKIERSSTETAIVSMVLPGTQAESAGIRRGDILCFADTNGTEEINYDMFLELARSSQRPLCFEIRRVVAPSSKGSKTTTATSSSSNGSQISSSTGLSAEAYTRKQAMIAAAEKREKDHQKKYNTNKSNASNNKPQLKQIISTADKNRLEQERQQRILNEQSSDANCHSEYVQKAKDLEQQTVSQLGYNPYVTQSVSAGQARNVVTSTAHGTIQATTTPSNNKTSGSTSAPGIVASPSALLVATETNTNKDANSNSLQPQPSIEFGQAFIMTVTSTADHTAVINSITILRKLIINATTKGQSVSNNEENDDSSKYRKIRFMTNPKIRATVTDIPGAIDLLLSIGFQLHEEIVEDSTTTTTNESVLLYPPNTPGPTWLPSALKQMEQYVQQQQ